MYRNNGITPDFYSKKLSHTGWLYYQALRSESCGGKHLIHREFPAWLSKDDRIYIHAAMKQEGYHQVTFGEKCVYVGTLYLEGVCGGW